jgi:hypothetical protein
LEHNYLAIQYDASGFIRDAALVVNSGCISSGECISINRCSRDEVCESTNREFGEFAVLSMDQWWELTVSRIVVWASPSANEEGQVFRGRPERCRVFVYGSAKTLPVAVSREAGSRGVRIGAYGYLTWEGDPGIEQVTLSWIREYLTLEPWDRHLANLPSGQVTREFSCEPGQPVFLSVERDYSWRTGASYDLHKVSRSRGEVAVKARWMVVE